VRVGTYPTRNFAYSFLTQTFDNVGAEAFLTSLHVAMQMGPYLQLFRTVWRMASEDSARIEQSFLLIVRTRRIVTAHCSSAGFSGFPAYSQILLRQLLSYLRTVHRCCSSKHMTWSGWIEYQLSWSPMRSDHLIPHSRGPGVWPLRILLALSSLSC
jgi:hypothetical protein